MRVYISGPITNNPDYKRQFEKAELKLKAQGYTVINPSKIDDVIPDGTHSEYMSVDLTLLDMCDAIYMISGWGKSKGACIEYGFAYAKDKIMMVE